MVRRGIFIYPQVWGEGPAGTNGGEDIFRIAEVTNGSPHIYALWPHAASLFLRGQRARRPTALGRDDGKTSGKGRRRSTAGWDPTRPRALIDTPYTQGVAGWIRGEPASFPQLEVATENPFAVLVATSISNRADRLNRSASLLGDRPGPADRLPLGGPTGRTTWPTPDIPPSSRSPLMPRSTGGIKGRIRAFVLNNEGERHGSVPVEGVARR